MPPSHISIPIPGMTATISSGQVYSHYGCISILGETHSGYGKPHPSSHTHCWNLSDTRHVGVDACFWLHSSRLNCTRSGAEEPGTEPKHIPKRLWERSPHPQAHLASASPLYLRAKHINSLEIEGGDTFLPAPSMNCIWKEDMDDSTWHL